MPKAGQPEIAFLLGKPLHCTSVISGVVERLHHRFPTILLHCPGENTDLPDALSRADLVVQRGLSYGALRASQRLEHAGVRCVNSVGATLACNNRAEVMSLLNDAGLPVPSTERALTWQQAVVAAQNRPVVVKRQAADMGRGAYSGLQ